MTKIILEKPKKKSSEFSLSQTLECGQFFRFNKLSDNNYIILIGDKLVEIVEKTEILECGIYESAEKKSGENTEKNLEENEKILTNLFDFNTDYEEIKEVLSENDEVMREAIKLCGGIHIMNQEPFEVLLSFIISQNNNIPRIKSIINRLSKTYGNKIDYNNEEEFFGFPKLDRLIDVDIAGFAENCGTGFRSKYLADAVKSVNDKKVIVNFDEDEKKLTEKMETEELREILVSIYGVGRKVSDCCLLFGYKRKEVYPVDVWIKRMTQELYFEKEEISNEELQKFAVEKFGKYAGFAQQYLFHYGRNLL